MIKVLVNALFGCSHQKTTFPLTSGRTFDHTYVVCLHCGTEFDYDWKEMRMGKAVHGQRGMAVTSEPAVQAPTSAAFSRRSIA
jgi:hypothetical protein